MKFVKKFFQISDPKYWDMVSHAGTVGLHLALCTVLGLAMGFFLDKWLDTKPWLTLVFLVIGIAAGYKNMYLETKWLQRKHYSDDVDKKD
ncbi:MAG: AtpZ/AtpI family protein [Desulfovibrionaceae bacterium]